DFFDGARAADGGPATFLIDEILDIRTFESFPGLRHVQRDLVARIAASPSRFVLASRFTARTHRLLWDAPAKFEVIHVPPLETLVAMGYAADPVAALAALCSPDGRLTARARESYEFRLHRARGYGALKAILGVLAADEPLNLTEISQRLHRTPGSTKD